ncbi:MAG: VanW family protein [Clostridia bacterium]|nr:VanW family protein [Clostridia bacterium]
MNDWKKILEQMSEDSGDGKQFRTTEINIQRTKKKKKRILGVHPAFFWSCIGVFVLVIALGGLWISNIFTTVADYDLIFPGVTAMNIELGGMTEAEAVEALNAYSENYFSGKELEIRCSDARVGLDASVTIYARDIIKDIDAEAIAAKAFAYGRDRSTFWQFRRLKSDDTYELPISALNGYDREAVDRVVEKLVKSVEREYRNYSYTLSESGLMITRGIDGIDINQAALADDIHRRISSGEYGEYVITAPILDVTIAEVPDWNILRETFLVIAQDAYIEKSGSRGYRIVEETIGKDVDIQQINVDMMASDWDVKTYPFVFTTPQVTAQLLEDVLFRDVIGQAESTYNRYEVDRTTNVRLATEKVNEIILLPGEEFSFNNIVGERTEERGFRPAIVFAGGELVDGVGGGICQVSSTLYLACLRADLAITERSPHAYRVDYVPLGQDATVQWGYLDYRFVNNTAYPVRISAVMSDTTLTITLYGTKTDPEKRVEVESVTLNTYPYETRYVYNPELAYGEYRQTQSGKEGYQCETYQLIYAGDSLIERRLVDKSYYKSRVCIIEINREDIQAGNATQP